MQNTNPNLAYLIDDDEIIIYLTERLLLNEQYCKKIRHFIDPIEALNSLKKAISTGIEIPEFILLDLNMPRMDGWHFIEHFRTLKVNIPIFIITSSINPSDKVRAYQINEVKDFIIKPLTKITATKILRKLN